MAMTNKEIILHEAILNNYSYNGSNLNTYTTWKRKGYQVQKGQKAIINTSLWKHCSFKDKKTGESTTRILMVKASLFGVEQVEKIN